MQIFVSFFPVLSCRHGRRRSYAAAAVNYPTPPPPWNFERRAISQFFNLNSKKSVYFIFNTISTQFSMLISTGSETGYEIEIVYQYSSSDGKHHDHRVLTVLHM